jgi:predicted nucleic acid-binding protein
VSEIWVANASPIIVLAKIARADLLTNLSRELLIPQAVVDEIVAGPSDDPARQLIENGWGTRSIPQTVPSNLLEWGLGPGETSVLAVAQERTGAIAVLDDAVARTCAKAIGVPVIGSLGIIVRAKNQGLLTSASDATRALRNVGLYLDDDVLRRVLQSVGESWN